MGLRHTWFSAWKHMEARRREANARVVGAVELPRPGEGCVHVLEVKGWARGRAGEPATVRVEAGGRVVAEMAADQPRQDLTAAHPGLPGVAEGGFQALVKASALPGGPMLWLKVSAAVTGAEPRVWETLHAVPVFRGKGFTSSLPRHAYGRVWDRSSSNLSRAKVAVAGYDDDDEWRRTGESSTGFLIEQLGIQPTDTVLEIGCGAARVGVHLAGRCKEWIGCDVSASMLRHARLALQGQPNATFVHLNGYDLGGVGDSSVDVVYCVAVFMHLEEWDRYRYVCEAFRVLRPGGRIYFDNFNLLSAEGWRLFVETGRLDVANRPPNVSKASTPDELRCYAERAGFDDIDVRADGGIWVGVAARKPAAAPQAQ